MPKGSVLIGRRKPDDPATWGYPLERSNDRVLDAGFTGLAVTCDIDKTYLDTRFERVQALARIPLEISIDKVPVKGAVPLLQALRRNRGGEPSPLYFLSSSPRQLRIVLERRLQIDEIDFDGLTLKDWWPVIRERQHGGLREHIGYKLVALLLNRTDFPPGTRELLLGDDAEKDVLAYSIYADLLAGNLRGTNLKATLAMHGVAPAIIETIVNRTRDWPELKDGVAGIHILETGLKPDRIVPFHNRVFLARDYSPLSRMLAAAGHLSWDDVLEPEEGTGTVPASWPVPAAVRRHATSGEGFDPKGLRRPDPDQHWLPDALRM